MLQTKASISVGERYFNQTTAAIYLNISVPTFKKYFKQGLIEPLEPHSIRTRVLFSKTNLDKLSEKI